MTRTPKGEVMKSLLLFALTITLTNATIAARPTSAPEPRRVKRTMKPFRSQRQLARYFAALAEKHRRDEARRAAKERRKAQREARRAAKPSGDMVVVTANEAPALNTQSSEVGLYTTTEAITNVQHAGVDEGGIVKVHGNHLVVLRRGRLFTIAINDGELNPVSAIDAFGPD